MTIERERCRGSLLLGGRGSATSWGWGLVTGRSTSVSGEGDVALGILELTQNGLDDTDSDGLSHVTNGESTQRWVLSVRLDTQWLGGNHLDDTSLAGLEEFWVVLSLLTSSLVHQGDESLELASNVSGVAIQHWSVTGHDSVRVVQHNDLGLERRNTQWRVSLGVTSDHATLDILDRHVLHVEADVVTWASRLHDLVVHLDGLDLSGQVDRSEGNDHAGLEDTGLDTADWYSANTTIL